MKRNGTRSLLLWSALLLCCLRPASGWAAGGVDFLQRSISPSGQCFVYCDDVRLRLAVISYVETAKRNVLTALGQGDHWKFPIVAVLRRPAATEAGMPLGQVQLIETEEGWKVELRVALREGEMRDVRFPQLVIRALLLEMAYRAHPPEAGTVYKLPPAWLVEGLAQRMQGTDAEPNAALFRQLIETGRIPKIRDFLNENTAAMDATSLAVHGAFAASLLDLLTESPEGRANLARMIKELPDADADPAALLLRYFPALGGTEASLEKWWTLGLARTSTLDRHLALSVPDTDARLAPLLRLNVVTDEKKKTAQEFALADFKAFLKFPGAQAALFAQFNAVADLQRRAHPLLRPVMQEYLRVLDALAHGKTRGMGDALKAVENYRGLIVERMDKISDYLNWYEATQMPMQSGAFDDFLKGAKALENATPPKRTDAVSKYIDQLQREFE